MSRRYEAVLFDVDGTLLDTSEGIVKSVKETIEHFGLPCPPDEDLLKFIGPPIECSATVTATIICFWQSPTTVSWIFWNT